MGRKIIKALLIFSIVISSTFLYAGNFSIGGSLEYRDSISTINTNAIDLFFGYEDFFLNFQMQALEEFSASAIYDLRVGKTLHNEFILHTLYVPKEGGFSDLSYLFSQAFEWKYFALSYGLGVQVGLAYSPLSSEYLWSLSPLVKVEGKLIFNPVSLSVGLSLNSEIERSWKAVPIYSAKLEWDCNENNKIFLSAFARQAEYLMDPWKMITAWGVSLGYSYRGQI